MTKPVFSIITCTYNSERFVRHTIRSVSRQSNPHFEHIFVDGRSTDKTIDYITKYKARFPHQVRLYRSQAKGIANAMNLGIRKAKGKYIIHLHSDDYFYDKSVLSRVENYLLKEPQLDWVYGQINVIEQDGNSIGKFPRIWVLQQGYRYLLMFINFIPHQAVFVKRSVFKKYGNFDESFHTNMDQDLWLRLNYRTAWGYMPITVSNYRVHRNSQSSSKVNFRLNRVEYRKVQDKYLSNIIERTIARIINILEENINRVTR